MAADSPCLQLHHTGFGRRAQNTPAHRWPPAGPAPPACGCPAATPAELRPTDVLLDLYCGTGTIGLALAAACRQVVGVEISAAAVADARRNAARNGITNASFLQVGTRRAPTGRPSLCSARGLALHLPVGLLACGLQAVIQQRCSA